MIPSSDLTEKPESVVLASSALPSCARAVKAFQKHQLGTYRESMTSQENLPRCIGANVASVQSFSSVARIALIGGSQTKQIPKWYQADYGLLEQIL